MLLDEEANILLTGGEDAKVCAWTFDRESTSHREDVMEVDFPTSPPGGSLKRAHEESEPERVSVWYNFLLGSIDPLD
jgi:hypothetical protein